MPDKQSRSQKLEPQAYEDSLPLMKAGTLCQHRKILVYSGKFCVDTGIFVLTQEVLRLCQPFQSNQKTLCRHRKIAVY